ncbi:DUF4157 domain-containing protein [Nannocystis sp. SCPEA4]|uniref:eCIS core domain-containing protein n=1 Tax=Nannocystis sp. SCPEA4 TaxID=2996787 RepID=UPI002270CD54|nr:DUF4157 domain-containing protein [Nannocystis sp. SCPEA4]MCY1060367.1 DUF4157 domain-containing protein [Nannocystis sp. SCPEA4]
MASRATPRPTRTGHGRARHGSSDPEHDRLVRRAVSPFSLARADSPEEIAAERAADAAIRELRYCGTNRASGSSSGAHGQSLPPAVRRPLESAMRRGFSQARIHTGPEARRIADTAGADAITYKHDIFFGTDKFRPDTLSGMHLLAHELAHATGAGADRAAPHARLEGHGPSPGELERMRRAAGDHTEPTRRLAALGRLTRYAEPSPHEENAEGLSFELVDGRLLARVKRPDDIAGLVTLAGAFAGLSREVEGPPPKRFDPTAVAIPGTVDMTEYLPASVQQFMAAHQQYLRYAAEFDQLNAAAKRTGGKLGKATRQQWTAGFAAHATRAETTTAASQGRGDLERRLAVVEQEQRRLWEEKPGAMDRDLDREAADTRVALRDLSPADYESVGAARVDAMRARWAAPCHAFTLLLFREASSLASSADIYAIVDSLKRERVTSRSTRDARVGDLAVFTATETSVARSDYGIVHSALVIRVSGPDLADIEVLEKRDPNQPMSTRTVAQIVSSMPRVRPNVHFVRHPRRPD